MAKTSTARIVPRLSCTDLEANMKENSDLYSEHFGDDKLKEGGLIVGNLMGCQAAFRALAPGETRQALAAKVSVGLVKQPHMCLDQKLGLLLKQLSGNNE